MSLHQLPALCGSAQKGYRLPFLFILSLKLLLGASNMASHFRCAGFFFIAQKFWSLFTEAIENRDLRIIHVELMVETMRGNELTREWPWKENENEKRVKDRAVSTASLRGIGWPCTTVQHQTSRRGKRRDRVTTGAKGQDGLIRRNQRLFPGETCMR